MVNRRRALVVENALVKRDLILVARREGGGALRW